MSKARRRRDESKEQFWRGLVKGFDAKQTTIRRWCADHGVSEPSFYAWRRELKRRDEQLARTSRPKQRISLLPVKVLRAVHSGSKSSAARLIVCLPSKVRLYVTVDQLRCVLDVLTSASSVEPERRPC